MKPKQAKAFESKPRENASETSRMLAGPRKKATILEGHFGSLSGLRSFGKNSAFRFLGCLFNPEEWAAAGQLRGDTGVNRQVEKNQVAWRGDHIPARLGG